jgi:ankyrin repeat protein
MGSSGSKQHKTYDDLDENSTVLSLDHIQMVLYHNYKIPLEELRNLSTLEIKNKYGAKLLLESITTNNIERLKELVEGYSIDVNNLDVLEKACKFSGKEVIEYLFENFYGNIDELRNKNWILFLNQNQKITLSDLSSIIIILITKDFIDFDRVFGDDDFTLLLFLVRNKLIEPLKYLLEKIKASDINKKDKNGDTALMYAAMIDNNEMVDLLLDYGADAYIKDTKGKTAVDLAKGYTVDVFTKRKIHPTLPEKFEMTDDVDIISKCTKRYDLITTYNIRKLDEVYMVKQDDDSYNCYSLGEIIHIRDLKKRKKLDALERLGDFRQLTKDFDLEELFVKKSRSSRR